MKIELTNEEAFCLVLALEDHLEQIQRRTRTSDRKLPPCDARDYDEAKHVLWRIREARRALRPVPQNPGSAGRQIRQIVPAKNSLPDEGQGAPQAPT